MEEIIEAVMDAMKANGCHGPGLVLGVVERNYVYNAYVSRTPEQMAEYIIAGRLSGSACALVSGEEVAQHAEEVIAEVSNGGQHTQTPWRVRDLMRGGEVYDCFVEAPPESGMAYGLEVMGDDYTGFGDLERKRADARRIVACVNACAGIETEALERMPRPFGDLLSKPFIPKVRRGWYEVDEVHELTEQRDKLLALAECVAKLNRDAGEIGAGMLASLVDEAREAVASVKGGAA